MNGFPYQGNYPDFFERGNANFGAELWRTLCIGRGRDRARSIGRARRNRGGVLLRRRMRQLSDNERVESDEPDEQPMPANCYPVRLCI